MAQGAYKPAGKVVFGLMVVPAVVTEQCLLIPKRPEQTRFHLMEWRYLCVSRDSDGCTCCVCVLQQAGQDFPNNEGLANPPYPIQMIADLLQEQQVPLTKVPTPQTK